MSKAFVEVAILAHLRLQRHTRFRSSANDDQHAGHDREDSHRNAQVVEAQIDQANHAGQD
jgi:hypothetical protein